MPLGLQAIIPKNRQPLGTPEQIERQVTRALTQYGMAVARKMSAYPPQLPPISQSPRLGRRPYRRTGDYGRFWMAPGALRVQGATVTLVNRVIHNGRSYGVYVGGPRPGEGAGRRQAEIMRRRGWPSISDVARQTVKAYKPIINRALAGRSE